MLRRNIGDTSGKEGGIYGVCPSFGGIFNARPDLRKDDQLNSLLYEYWLARGAHHTYDFLFRGPLSPQQVNEELTELEEEVLQKSRPYGPVDSNDMLTVPSIQNARYWSGFIGQHMEGDRFYAFLAIRNHLGDILNLQGYVLIRKGRVVSVQVTMSS
mgnify:FL=1